MVEPPSHYFQAILPDKSMSTSDWRTPAPSRDSTSPIFETALSVKVSLAAEGGVGTKRRGMGASQTTAEFDLMQRRNVTTECTFEQCTQPRNIGSGGAELAALPFSWQAQHPFLRGIRWVGGTWPGLSCRGHLLRDGIITAKLYPSRRTDAAWPQPVQPSCVGLQMVSSQNGPGTATPPGLFCAERWYQLLCHRCHPGANAEDQSR